MTTHRKIAFQRIADATRANCAAVATNGCRAASATVVRPQPRRNDQRIGSFRIDLRTGAWAGFAIDQRGGDPIALAAYLYGVSQAEIALKIAEMLGATRMTTDPFRPSSAAQARRKSMANGLRIVRVPADAPPPPTRHPTLGRPTKGCTYPRKNGEINR